jgi:hypothetical protein
MKGAEFNSQGSLTVDIGRLPADSPEGIMAANYKAAATALRKEAQSLHPDSSRAFFLRQRASRLDFAASQIVAEHVLSAVATTTNGKAFTGLEKWDGSGRTQARRATAYVEAEEGASNVARTGSGVGSAKENIGEFVHNQLLGQPTSVSIKPAINLPLIGGLCRALGFYEETSEYDLFVKEQLKESRARHLESATAEIVRGAIPDEPSEHEVAELAAQYSGAAMDDAGAFEEAFNATHFIETVEKTGERVFHSPNSDLRIQELKNAGLW